MKGNSHTRESVPFVLVGNGLDFHMGRSLKFGRVPHNRLLEFGAEYEQYRREVKALIPFLH